MRNLITHMDIKIHMGDFVFIYESKYRIRMGLEWDKKNEEEPGYDNLEHM